MLAVQVKIDERSLKEAERIMRSVPRGFPRVMRRAINRTVDMAATDLKRRTADQIKLPKGEVAKGIGKHKASYSKLGGSIDALPYRPALTKFPGTRQLKRGVKYRIGKEGFKTIEHTFIAKMRSGHRGVLKRTGPSHLPIQELRGPSIWKVITGGPGLLTAANQKAVENLSKQVNAYMSLELKRWAK